jgi:antitoxin VapB
MATAKVFMSGRSQAVRLPKEFRVEATELAIKRVGNTIVLSPVEAGWDEFFRLLGEFENVDKIERNQPTEQQSRPSLADE